MKEAIVESSALNTVKLVLAQDSNVFTGERNFTISNIKAKGSNVAMDKVKTTITLNENVAPKLDTAKVKNDSTLVLTFTEAITGVVDASFELSIDNKALATKATLDADGKTVVITLATAGESFVAGKTVTVKAATGNAIKDLKGNALIFTPQNITIPSTIGQ
ncbi:MAG: Ig-like domain-containing protein [Lysinibacillus sp.]